MAYISKAIVIVSWFSILRGVCSQMYDYSYNANAKQFTRRIVLKQGALQGVVVEPTVNRDLPAVEQYLGIPYAAAPVGGLRFMPPGSAPPWFGVKIADTFGPVCPQKFPDTQSMAPDRKEYFKRIVKFLLNQHEDCLYLNIYAPLQGERILELLPPNSRKTCVPCSHCTIYVCRLPKECTEEHLYNLFSDYGQIQEIKLTIGKEGYTRGYAFIRYQHAKNACIAIKRCNGQNLYNVDDSKHFRIGISHSPGPQLLITGIPMDLTEASVEQTLEECLTGLESVLLPKNINDDSLNRGYAFATFDSYENASKARRKIWYYKTALWSSLCMVEWALPEMPSLSDDEHPALGLRCAKIPSIDGTINSPSEFFAGFPPYSVDLL